MPWDEIVRCSGCKGECTHHIAVAIFSRQNEDGESKCAMFGFHENWLPENPSSRRDGLVVLLRCENCPALTEFRILQHKGTTYTNQGVADV